MQNSVARRYLRQVKWRLVCPKSHRERLETQARAMIFGFAEEYPEAKYEQYVANFGAPQVFADAILDEVDREQVQKAKRQRRFICWGLAACLAAVLAAVSVFWYIQYEEMKDLRKNIVIVEFPPEEMTEEEFQKILDNASKNKLNGG